MDAEQENQGKLLSWSVTNLLNVMAKIALFIFCVFNLAANCCAQKKKPATILKSVSDTLHIRYDDYLDSLSWVVSSKKGTDILPIEIDENSIRITFISSIDSISFHVNVGDNYDFIITNGEKQYKTKIKGIKAYQTSEDDSLANINLQCLKTDLLSVAERNKKYPFNKAIRIELISFRDTSAQFFTPLPVKKGRLEDSKVPDRKVLDTSGVNELTDILFNIGRTPVPNLKFQTTVYTKCYEPRNGILFINSQGRVFEYIEICFGCQGNRFSSKRIKRWDDCEQKYDILRRFFADQGIKFGTDEHH